MLRMGPKVIRSTVLTTEEEAVIVAFRKHTLLPLDDCLYALKATIPHLTRSSLHRCLQRHGISRLPEVEGNKPKQPFKTYPIGYFHIDIAEVRTDEAMPPVGDPTLLSSYKTLTVDNYVGEGGQIRMNTYLASDGSPSDLLVINGGTASGTTGLLFDNTGGGGALTTGDGILVVDAMNGGTTVPGAFAGFASAGPYDYLLFRGGSTPGSENDLFLRSSLQPVPSEPLVPGGRPQLPGTSGPSRPRFRPEVSLYAAMPVMAAIYGRNMIDTLHERMGGNAQLLGPGKPDSPDGMWGRIIGYWGHRDGDPVGIYGRRRSGVRL